MSLTDFLTGIANAIRSKTGSSDPIPAQNFAAEITNIPTGGSDIISQIENEGVSVDVSGYDASVNYTGPNSTVHFLIEFKGAAWSQSSKVYIPINKDSNAAIANGFLIFPGSPPAVDGNWGLGVAQNGGASRVDLATYSNVGDARQKTFAEVGVQSIKYLVEP